MSTPDMNPRVKRWIIVVWGGVFSIAVLTLELIMFFSILGVQDYDHSQTQAQIASLKGEPAALRKIENDAAAKVVAALKTDGYGAGNRQLLCYLSITEAAIQPSTLANAAVQANCTPSP